MGARNRMWLLAGLMLATTGVQAAQLDLSLTLPRLQVAEYHRPYLAVWVERVDQSVAANLAVWYASGDNDGTRWLTDLRQWWRRSGREQALPLDGVTGATRPAGLHRLQFSSAQGALAALPAGDYVLAVEAVRESGGREALRLPFSWPPAAESRATVQGTSELGAVVLVTSP